jgi:hypothetical protein
MYKAMTAIKEENLEAPVPTISKREEFLRAVERKTENKVHHRLLEACEKSDASKEIEAELTKIISEIFYET